jgi:hypothetical protein
MGNGEEVEREFGKLQDIARRHEVWWEIWYEHLIDHSAHNVFSLPLAFEIWDRRVAGANRWSNQRASPSMRFAR